jgi:hypothetical protein
VLTVDEVGVGLATPPAASYAFAPAVDADTQTLTPIDKSAYSATNRARPLTPVAAIALSPLCTTADAHSCRLQGNMEAISRAAWALYSVDTYAPKETAGQQYSAGQEDQK